VSARIQGLEQVGGFTGKAGTLAEGALYSNDPAFYKTVLRRYATATPTAVKAAAGRWMNDGDFRLTVVPGTRSPEDVARAGGGVGNVVSGGGGAGSGAAPGGPLYYQQPGRPRAAATPARAVASIGPSCPTSRAFPSSTSRRSSARACPTASRSSSHAAAPCRWSAWR
jgi:hypothetical protein